VLLRLAGSGAAVQIANLYPGIRNRDITRKIWPCMADSGDPGLRLRLQVDDLAGPCLVAAAAGPHDHRNRVTATHLVAQ
jgi:hypothetical protein